MATVGALITALLALIYTYTKKDVTYFLTFLSVSLGVIAVVSPWWVLQGSSSDVTTSATLFLLPQTLVTVTTTSSVIAGELMSLPEIFVYILSLIVVFTALGYILLLTSFYFKKTERRTFYIASVLFTSIFLVVSLVIFFVGASVVTEIGIGGVTGEGNLEVGIPGEETVVSIGCSWGPAIGFYLYLVSLGILWLILGSFVSKKYAS
jgi:hypothetical protein